MAQLQIHLFPSVLPSAPLLHCFALERGVDIEDSKCALYGHPMIELRTPKSVGANNSSGVQNHPSKKPDLKCLRWTLNRGISEVKLIICIVYKIFIGRQGALSRGEVLAGWKERRPLFFFCWGRGAVKSLVPPLSSTNHSHTFRPIPTIPFLPYLAFGQPHRSPNTEAWSNSNCALHPGCVRPTLRAKKINVRKMLSFERILPAGGCHYDMRLTNNCVIGEECRTLWAKN